MKLLRQYPLTLLAAFYLALVLFVIPAGYLTWDSGTYHLMLNALFGEGSFVIGNAYDELPAEILKLGHTVAPDGHLVAQYPELYTFVAAPFYLIFGYKGLLILNTLAFLGTCWLIWFMARWFTDDPRAPAAAALIYALSTYALDQTVSSYPHHTATFLIALAFTLYYSVILDRPAPFSLPGRKFHRLLLSGICLGLAIGVRLDSVLAGLAFAVPLLTGRGIDWRRGLWVLCGMAGPLLLLSLINYLKFGVFNFMSYGHFGGSGLVTFGAHYIPVVGAAALFCLIYAYRDLLIKNAGQGRLGLLALGLIALFLPIGYINPQFPFMPIQGLLQIVGDLRLRPDYMEPGMTRSDGGAVLYFDYIKKSLLQSAPFLILLIVPALRRWLDGKTDNSGYLWLVPLGFIGVYGSLGWHGSVGTTMRYLNPALPFLALLTAYELIALAKRADSFLPYRLFYVPLLIVLCALFLSLDGNPALKETIILDLAWVLAGCLLLLQILDLRGMKLGTIAPATALTLALPFALIWSAALTLSQDLTFALGVRSYYRAVAAQTIPKIPDDALVLTYSPNGIWPVIERASAPLIATYSKGNCADLENVLTKFALNRPTIWMETNDADEGEIAKWKACFPIAVPGGGTFVLGGENIAPGPTNVVIRKIEYLGVAHQEPTE